MKKTWTTEHIVILLREAESGTTSISELCRQKGISQIRAMATVESTRCCGGLPLPLGLPLALVK